MITDPNRDRVIVADRERRSRENVARLMRVNPDGPLGRRLLDRVIGMSKTQDPEDFAQFCAENI